MPKDELPPPKNRAERAAEEAMTGGNAQPAQPAPAPVPPPSPQPGQ